MLPPTGRRTPFLALTAVAVGLFVVGGILLVGRLGVPAEAPSPSFSGPSAAPTDPTATPEGAVRAFFMAFATARQTDDPAAIASLVTGTNSPAYLSVSSFLDGQKAAKKASIVTVLRLENLISTINGGSASVTFDYTEGGYDIDLQSGSALESPKILPSYHVTAILRNSGSRWLVDSYTSRP